MSRADEEERAELRPSAQEEASDWGLSGARETISADDLARGVRAMGTLEAEVRAAIVRAAAREREALVSLCDDEARACREAAQAEREIGRRALALEWESAARCAERLAAVFRDRGGAQ